MSETKPPIWKVILNALYTALTFGKAQGWFQKGKGPDIPKQ